MRRVVTFFLLVGMLGGFGVLMYARPAPPELAPSADAKAEGADAKAEAAASESGGADTDADTDTDGGDEAAAPAEKDDEVKVVRVAGLGWELLAPGVLANDGLDPGEGSAFTKGGIEAHFAAVADTDAIQRQLARGGGDEKGADIALLPLPDFVASYERLRGLEPQVFFVIGWSDGRDAVATERAGGLGKLPVKDDISLQGRPGSSAALLGLFALELSGVSAERIELTAPAEGKKPMFEAIERSLREKKRTTDARDLLVTTADATSLVPIVAIAPRGYITRHHGLLEQWSRLWLEGTEQLRADVPGASRRLASEKGAPEPVDLLDGLGWIRHAGLRDNAHLAGLAGRGAVTVDELFHRTWSLWRGVGILSTPAPERVPMTNEIIAGVALGGDVTSSAGADGKRRDKLRPLLVHEVAGDELDEHALVDELGFIAGVFERAEIELRVRKKAGDPEALILAATRRFDLADGRLKKGKSPRKGPVATIEVRVPR
ncbi:MAG: hypothetical protein H6713_12730 [Myxococcales bacterium]|nr:hypothetical protein [Myxococcales bacterium]MCB9750844.1 hypothetical protein [Myxococcales bacterium]